MKTFKLTVTFLTVLVTMFYLSCSTTSAKPSVKDMSKGTVMITNALGNSGGSGVVIGSSSSSSQILTNGHVCEVTRKGGFVIPESNERIKVTKFVKSNLHDLCVITVNRDLGVDTPIASGAPRKGDIAHIIGHPNLRPTTVSDGYYSGREMITIMVGVKACTRAEFENPNTGIFCVLAGGIPVLKRYDAIALSALIMPGSSGSAIYNENGEISALVFAGKGDLGFAYAVPVEYIQEFLGQELSTLPSFTPPSEISILGEDTEEKKKFDFDKACEHAETTYQKYICRFVLDELEI